VLGKVSEQPVSGRRRAPWEHLGLSIAYWPVVIAALILIWFAVTAALGGS